MILNIRILWYWILQTYIRIHKKRKNELNQLQDAEDHNRAFQGGRAASSWWICGIRAETWVYRNKDELFFRFLHSVLVFFFSLPFGCHSSLFLSASSGSHLYLPSWSTAQFNRFIYSTWLGVQRSYFDLFQSFRSIPYQVFPCQVVAQGQHVTRLQPQQPDPLANSCRRHRKTKSRFPRLWTPPPWQNMAEPTQQQALCSSLLLHAEVSKNKPWRIAEPSKLNRQAMAKPSPCSQASDMKPSSFSPMAANVFCTSCRGFQSSAIQVSALVSNAAHGRKAASTDCPWVVSVHWNILKSFLVGQVCFLFFVAGSFQTPELLGTCDWSECQVLTSIENDSEAVEHQSAPIAHQRPVTRRVNLILTYTRTTLE